MGYTFAVAMRYLRSKKQASVSVGTLLATLGVALGVAALAIVMSVTGGFKQSFREKVLGVNAHVLILKYSLNFSEYRSVMERVKKVPGIEGIAPFVINPMMVTHETRTATGVLLKGVDPELLPTVLDLPKHIIEGSLDGLRRPGAMPPERTPHPLPQRDPPNPLDRRGGDRERGDRKADDRKNDDANGTPSPEFAPSSLVPEGGYQSSLPDDDVLPITDEDPCKNASTSAALPGAVIGRTLARQLNVKLGECIQITSPMIGYSMGTQATTPVAKQFRVIAVFDAGFDQYDAKLVYADLYEAQAFYEHGDSVTGIEMKISDIDNAQQMAKQLEQLLGDPSYYTLDWHGLNRGLFTALLIQQILMSVVLALVIVVAAFTVIATLIMVVLEKKKEVALLKAIGARDDAVLRIFMFQGGIIGLAGTISGLCLGYLGCIALRAYEFPLDPHVYFISRLPVSIRPTEFIITGAVALVICLLATIFPALYAAQMRPADGLRAE